jgi:hypothetical protein
MYRYLAVVMLTGCSVPDGATQDAAPPHQVKVLSTACDPNHGRAEANISVQNVGPTTIEWPKAVVSFGGAMSDTYIDPRPLRPGAIGTIHTYAPRGAGTADCSLVQIADGDGNIATLL